MTTIQELLDMADQAGITRGQILREKKKDCSISELIDWEVRFAKAHADWESAWQTWYDAFLKWQQSNGSMHDRVVIVG